MRKLPPGQDGGRQWEGGKYLPGLWLAPILQILSHMHGDYIWHVGGLVTHHASSFRQSGCMVVVRGTKNPSEKAIPDGRGILSLFSPFMSVFTAR